MSTSRRRSHQWASAAAGLGVFAILAGTAACSSSSGSSSASAPAQSTAQSTAPASGTASASAPSSAGGVAANPGLSPIKIGFTTINQGTSAVPGPEQGAEAAVAYANKELGGIDGHPIQLDFCGVGADSQTNLQCGQHFANSSDAIVLTGLLFNGAPLYSALKASGKPIVGLVALTGPDLTSQAVFWTAGQYINAGTAAIALSENPSAKTLGFVADNASNGQGQWAEAKALVSGRATVKYASLSLSNPDALGAITSLGKVDAYLIAGQGVECVQSAEALKQLAPSTPVVSVQECAGNASAAGGAMNGWTYAALTQLPAASGNSPDVTTYMNQYPKFGAESFMSNVWTVGTWGLVLTARNVMAAAGVNNLGPAALTKAVANYTGPMVLGPSHLQCPGTLSKNVCANTVFTYKLSATGTSTPVAGSGFEVKVG